MYKGLSKFSIGTTVLIVKSSLVYGSTITVTGLRGTVILLDDTDGVCVQLSINKAWEPAFWFDPEYLAIDSGAELRPLAGASIEAAAVFKRNGTTPPDNAIMQGLMRAWLVSQLNARPGQAVFDLACAASWADLARLYMDGSNAKLRAWQSENDSRIKRALIDEGGPELVKVGDLPVIRRPKLV